MERNYPNFAHLTTKISGWIERFPDGRFGQIICNYICPDYRDKNPSNQTLEILNTLFPNNPDPFYEESYVTLERLSGTQESDIELRFVSWEEFFQDNYDIEYREKTQRPKEWYKRIFYRKPKWNKIYCYMLSPISEEIDPRGYFVDLWCRFDEIKDWKIRLRSLQDIKNFVDKRYQQFLIDWEKHCTWSAKRKPIIY